MGTADIKSRRRRIAASLTALSAIAAVSAGPANRSADAATPPASIAQATPPPAGPATPPATMPASTPATPPGPRVTIAVYGDSVAESYTVPNFLADGLPALLEDGLVKAGFSRGGEGLIPATPFRWKLKRSFVIGGMGSQPAKGWLLNGFGTQTGLNGPSGYSALAVSTAATATAPIDSSTVAVLYTKYANGPTFTASAGGKSWTISTSSIGPPLPTETWLNVPAGAKTLKITGPASGQLIFDGAISRKPVAAGTIQTEVENLGHMGHLLGQDLTQLVQESIVEQRFNISVFLGGYLYIEEAGSGQADRRAKEYDSNLMKYVNLIRTYGGTCLIVDPTPLAAPAKLVARFDSIDRNVAEDEGCGYSNALTHLWSPKTSVAKKLTLVDDIHPTSAGYSLMVKALMPELELLVRDAAKGDEAVGSGS